MSICKTTRFVINKNQNNEFVFTIKKLGSLDAMPIHSNSVTEKIIVNRTVNHTDYVAPFEGVKEKYSVEITSDMINDTSYSLVINSATIAVIYSESIHINEYNVLSAFKTAIEANGTANSLVDCVVDEGKLYITHKSVGTSFTLNGSDIFTINQIDGGLPSVSEVAESNIAPIEIISVPIGTPSSERTIVSRKVKLNSSISGINGGAYTTEYYTIQNPNTTTSLDIEFGEQNAGSSNSYTTEIEIINEYATGDTFIARVYKLDTGAQYGSDISIVANADGNQILAPIGLAGRITLKLANVYCTAMESAKGSAADRYYLKPGYRLAIECDTIENGKFTAKVPLVYVE